MIAQFLSWPLMVGAASVYQSDPSENAAPPLIQEEIVVTVDDLFLDEWRRGVFGRV